MIRPITSRRVLAARFTSQREHTGLEALFDLTPMLWMKSAQCINEDPEMFFQRDSAFSEALARRVCSGCPVILECLEYALERDERGWWGGMSRRQRKALLAAREVTGKARSA